jgi:predicted RNA methylase
MVLDAGVGILPCLCAAAGARRVYAIESRPPLAAAMAKMTASNGYAGVVQIMEVETKDIKLPQKVDILLAEPMGTCLVDRSSLKAFVRAREQWLEPAGWTLPSNATMHFAPFQDDWLHEERVQAAHFWDNRYDGICLTDTRCPVLFADCEPVPH